MFAPSIAPSPMSTTPRTALVMLMPISGIVVAIATSAPPAAPVSPHFVRSLPSAAGEVPGAPMSGPDGGHQNGNPQP